MGVRWGVKARVFFGAVTSMLDLVTDILVTAGFYGEPGKEGYFQASMASLILSTVLQLLLVILQHRKLGYKQLLKECVSILLGYKPALDAYRVATGAKQAKGA